MAVMRRVVYPNPAGKFSAGYRIGNKLREEKHSAT